MIAFDFLEAGPRARKAAELLRSEYSVVVDVWSVTSFNELRREALNINRENMLNPTKKQKIPFVTQKLSTKRGPVLSVTDYMKIHSDQIRSLFPMYSEFWEQMVLVEVIVGNSYGTSLRSI